MRVGVQRTARPTSAKAFGRARQPVRAEFLL